MGRRACRCPFCIEQRVIVAAERKAARVAYERRHTAADRLMEAAAGKVAAWSLPRA